MWLQKVLAELSLTLVISLSQCTEACWEFALEPIKLPFILSGVCSPSETNYCSNPFEVFYFYFKKNSFFFASWNYFLLTCPKYLAHLQNDKTKQLKGYLSTEKLIVRLNVPNSYFLIVFWKGFSISAEKDMIRHAKV